MSAVDQRTPDDCLRCTVATLLDLPYEDVPHFFAEAGLDCLLAVVLWAQERGLVADWGEDDPGVRCIATGLSPRHDPSADKRHAVVWHHGVEHDPHQSRGGLPSGATFFLTLSAPPKEPSR